jgi:hypothetical protein
MLHLILVPLGEGSLGAAAGRAMKAPAWPTALALAFITTSFSSAFQVKSLLLKFRSRNLYYLGYRCLMIIIILTILAFSGKLQSSCVSLVMSLCISVLNACSVMPGSSCMR